MTQHHGICESFHKTTLNKFYRVASRKKIYTSLEQLQADLDAWLGEYNETRPHQGRWCYGKAPMQTFLDRRRGCRRGIGFGEVLDLSGAGGGS